MYVFDFICRIKKLDSKDYLVFFVNIFLYFRNEIKRICYDKNIIFCYYFNFCINCFFLIFKN